MGPDVEFAGYAVEQFALPARPLHADLKSRECSKGELQAALVYLIDQYNEQGRRMAAAINRKADKPWFVDI